MSIAKSAAHAIAAVAAAGMLSCAMAQAAFAATSYPVSTAVSPDSVGGAAAQNNDGETQNRISVNVVDFVGDPGETVFISAKIGEQQIANFYPHTLGEGAQKVEGADVSADAFAIEVNRSAIEDKVADGIHVEVYDSRAGGKDHTLGSYDVCGVYAKFVDAEGAEVTKALIGTCTNGAKFTASENMAYQNKMYRLEGEATVTASDSDVEFTYKQYDPQSTVDGVIRYLDVKSGETLSFTTPISGLAKGESRNVTLPTSIKENGFVYRPLSFENSVKAENPGTTSFTVPVFALGADETTKSYTANISLVAGDETIATDAVFVKSEVPVVYTAPATIYKTRTVDGQRMVYTYKLTGQATHTFGLSGDARTEAKSFNYEQQAIDAPEVEVTFNLVNGQQRVSSTARKLADPEIAKVDKDAKTAQPTKTTIDVNGTTYKMVGQPSDYAYTYGSGEAPVVDVYYVPEGYTADEPYNVTVNYVNFFDRSVIDSETFESSPDSIGNVDFTAPEGFNAKGIDWVRLDGQGSSISHNYYSHRTTYTIYYRDSSQQLESAPTITQVVAAPATVTTTTTTAATTTTATGTAATGATGAATATTGAALRDGQTYNVAEGQGVNQTATAQDGRDATQERIEDDEVAMSSGRDAKEGANAAAAAAEQGMPGWVIPLVGIVAAALIAGVAAFFVSRRNDDGYGA